MKLKKQFIVREIMGDNVLVPCGDTAMDFNGLVTLNETALDVWRLLPEAEDEQALVDAMLDIYEVDEQTLRKDIEAFLSDLRKAEIIE